MEDERKGFFVGKNLRVWPRFAPVFWALTWVCENRPAQRRFFPTQSSIRVSARLRFSIELAMLKRRYPSPNSPNAVPERHATPACSRSASASLFDGHPVLGVVGKVLNGPCGA